MKLKGDTLIEVALAIGIFSLVAITIVSVTSAATSKAQSALETTITREELDAQAEALRFIHDSYVSGSQGKKNDTSNDYAGLWNKIAALAVSATDKKAVLDYRPETCSTSYNGDTGTLNTSVTGPDPFIINIRELGNLTKDNKDNTDNIIIASKEGEHGPFFPTSTYPRLLYSDGANSPGDEDADNTELDKDLHSQIIFGPKSEVERVEGVFIVAVKDIHETVVSGGANDNLKVGAKYAYYDFYIRSCWMPPGIDRASTISTVVRLYDPAVICYENCEEPSSGV